MDAIDKLSPEEFKLKLEGVLEDPQKLIDSLSQTEPEGEIQTLITKADQLGIKLKYSPELARGFDYYTDIVFEVFDLNPENNRAMFGGGRYDGLVSEFGVEPVPTIGFGMGDATLYNFLESNNLLPNLKFKTDLMLIPITEDDLKNVNQIAIKLRSEGKNVAIDYDISRKLKKELKPPISSKFQKSQFWKTVSLSLRKLAKSSSLYLEFADSFPALTTKDEKISPLAALGRDDKTRHSSLNLTL